MLLLLEQSQYTDDAMPMQAQAQKQKMSAKAQKKFAKRQAYGSSLPVNGLSSTLAFTPIQVRSHNRLTLPCCSPRSAWLTLISCELMQLAQW